MSTVPGLVINNSAQVGVLHFTNLCSTITKNIFLEKERQMDWLGWHYHVQTLPECEGQQKAHLEDQDHSILCICHQHTDLWHGIYARTEVKHFPHEEFTMPFYITWKDKVTNTEICARTGIPTTYTAQTKMTLQAWPCHKTWMILESEKTFFYRELKKHKQLDIPNCPLKMFVKET